MEKKRILVACGVVTLLAAAIITLLIATLGQRSGQPQTKAAEANVSGTLACLPHQNANNGQPQTLECAIGLKTDDGRYYKLQDLPQQQADTSPSARVRITGQLSQPAADEIYDVVGTVKVGSFTVLTSQ
jgi:hypothetical protein